MLPYAAFFVALVITMALIPPLTRLADRLSLMDLPDERKVHTESIPRIGGMAMVVGACIPILLLMPHGDSAHYFLAALLVLLIFGAWDDCVELGYRTKFFGQLLAVLLVVLLGGVKIQVLPLAGMEPVPNYLSVPVTLLFLVGVTNAVNLSDGLDGLAAGVSLLSLGAIALLAKLADGAGLILICFAVSGSIFGFLRYNTFPARIFMGDTGSQFLGFTIGVLTVMLTQQVNTALNPLLPLFLVGLPVVDTVFVMVKRILEGRSPFVADKNHVHHRLLSAGFAHYETVTIIYISQAIILTAAFFLRYQSDLVVLTVYIGLVSLMLAAVLSSRTRRFEAEFGRLTEQVSRFDRSSSVRAIGLGAMRIGIPVYLLIGVLFVADVPKDISLTSLILLVLLAVRLLLSKRLRFFSLRLLVFPAIAFAAYVMHRDSALAELLTANIKIGLLVILLLFMFVIIRSTKDQRFRTTPTDLLVIALTGGAGVLYQQGMLEITVMPLVLSVVVLFYAAELVMRYMQHTWNTFTLGMLAVLVIMSLHVA